MNVFRRFDQARLESNDLDQDTIKKLEDLSESLNNGCCRRIDGFDYVCSCVVGAYFMHILGIK